MLPANPRIPLALKLGFTAFMLVMIPVYWRNYGPTNFLYFCDVAMILTLVGIWLESSLLISMCAVGILIPQAIWVADFLTTIFGLKLTGMTAYMFNQNSPLFLRGLSSFHGWLPFLLVYLVYRLGYNRKGFLAWTVLAWVLLFICYFFMPGPDPNAGLKPVNINYVWGMNDAEAQTWMPANLWFAAQLIVLPALILFPTHLILKKVMPAARA